MITFYPADIPLWTDTFDFNYRHIRSITLECNPYKKLDYKTFKNRQELIEFLKEHKINLKDEKFPLVFDKIDIPNSMWDATHQVRQYGIIGWFKEDYK